MENNQAVEAVWVKASYGDAHARSLVGGQDITGEPIYVARAEYREDLMLGKFIASHGCTFLTWNGEEVKRYEYEKTMERMALLRQLVLFCNSSIVRKESDLIDSTSVFIDNKNKWVKSSNGNAPKGTLVGGHDINGEPIYVARASHNGDLIPGKLVATQHGTFVSWAGLEFKKDEYEVLVGSSNNWIAASNSNVPSNAFPGGKTDIGDTLYIGRVHFDGTITTGKVHKSHGICYIPFGGKELRFSDYKVLTF